MAEVLAIRTQEMETEYLFQNHMKRIFISYRRDDSAGHSGRLFDFLSNRFGRDMVFMDVDNIIAGDNFEQKIDEALNSTEIVLAVIGKDWLTIKNKEGRPRLFDDRDFVRLELVTALRRDITIIPLLLEGVEMPSKDDLPQELAKLSSFNAFNLSYAKWTTDLMVLTKMLEEVYNIRGSTIETEYQNYKRNIFLLGGITIALIIITAVLKTPGIPQQTAMLLKNILSLVLIPLAILIGGLSKYIGGYKLTHVYLFSGLAMGLIIVAPPETVTHFELVAILPLVISAIILLDIPLGYDETSELRPAKSDILTRSTYWGFAIGFFLSYFVVLFNDPAPPYSAILGGFFGTVLGLAYGYWSFKKSSSNSG